MSAGDEAQQRCQPKSRGTQWPLSPDHNYRTMYDNERPLAGQQKWH
jgi:hypothetical protein